jgi:guanylate kinase
MAAGKRGTLVVISAPSGAGKTTIAREIMKRNALLEFSVSATTRPKRAGEVEGRDYYFLTAEEVGRSVAADEFVEWEEVYGYYYGTLKKEVERALRAGRSVVFDVDVNGGISIKRHYPEAVLIFVAPPSMDVLKERLVKRRTENDETLQKRLDRVPMELEKGRLFDYQVVNDVLERAITAVQKIVERYLEKAEDTNKGPASCH